MIRPGVLRECSDSAPCPEGGRKSPIESELASLDYDLPQDRIAIAPAPQRQDARLFVYDRAISESRHVSVSCLPELLKTGDLLMLNDARVDPVRVVWKKSGGGCGEVVFLRNLEDGADTSVWEVVLSGRMKAGSTRALPGGLDLTLVSRGAGALFVVSLNASSAVVRRWLGREGKPPLPPYIIKARKRAGLPPDAEEDGARYQTVFASRPGAVAAPTAGLHLTDDILGAVRSRGADVAFLHLAVGWGTFEPVTADRIMNGHLHPERVDVPRAAAEAVLSARSRGRRVVAVGTTVVRALEWWWSRGAPNEGLSGWVDSFLRPPWRPSAVDALLTNFHLPRSSLLALVAAFLGEDGAKRVLSLYREAVDRGYRFYSFGDAMFIT